MGFNSTARGTQAFNWIIQCMLETDLSFSLLKVTVNLVYFSFFFFF